MRLRQRHDLGENGSGISVTEGVIVNYLPLLEARFKSLRHPVDAKVKMPQVKGSDTHESVQPWRHTKTCGIWRLLA